MNDRPSYSHFEMSDLAEGTQEISEAMQPTISLEPTTVWLIHSELGVKSPSAEESMVSQVDVELEGRDDNDAQDASLTRDETKASPNAQTFRNKAQEYIINLS